LILTSNSSRVELPTVALRCRQDPPHQVIDLVPVNLYALALLDQRPDIEVAHDAFHHVQGIEAGAVVERRGALGVFGQALFERA